MSIKKVESLIDDYDGSEIVDLTNIITLYIDGQRFDFTNSDNLKAYGDFLVSSRTDVPASPISEVVDPAFPVSVVTNQVVK